MIISAGAPPATEYGGRLCVTTLLAPMTQPFPIVIPGRMHTLLPIHTLSPIFTSPFEIIGRFNGASSNELLSVKPCELSVIKTFVPVRRLFPIVIL